MLYHDLRKPAKLADQREEDFLQRDCAEFAKKILLKHSLPQELFFHCPSEGQRKPQYLAKLKLMGFRAGIADCVFLIPKGEYHGLMIELKAASKGPSNEQKLFLDACASVGYLALVVNDFETFCECLTKYLEL